ncbi:hypothetical protein VA7868_01102 [Vibrio aerogenes CECT 7868]|uniref:Uncharacterized protein n=1 Tax=Vibrio aerogenes CECT 7868 TaxID=1216006 RepID=A0A1M5XD58_9VIBR|nr:hypothetical protein VA7868_01102 [Vibrio aerogenes CECT 7868]
MFEAIYTVNYLGHVDLYDIKALQGQSSYFQISGVI